MQRYVGIFCHSCSNKCLWYNGTTTNSMAGLCLFNALTYITNHLILLLPLISNSLSVTVNHPAWSVDTWWHLSLSFKISRQSQRRWVLCLLDINPGVTAVKGRHAVSASFCVRFSSWGGCLPSGWRGQPNLDLHHTFGAAVNYHQARKAQPSCQPSAPWWRGIALRWMQ